MALKFDDRVARRIVREHKEKLDREKGLLCFSADWTDPALWSHYAAKHTGICLGFDLRESLAIKVTYQQKRLAGLLKPNVAAMTDEIAEELFCTKFESWKYEKEWRVSVKLKDAVEEGNLHFFDFNDDLKLTEVILGSLCSLNVAAVRTLTSRHHPGATTFQARLASKSFNIVPDERSVPLVAAA